MSPGVRQSELLDVTVSTLESQGWDVAVLQEQRPFRLHVTQGSVASKLIVYIWAATHGGGQRRSPDEYRIQMTGVEAPLLRVPGWTTLVLGLSSELILTAWDHHYHQEFTVGSPSLQTSRASMLAAVSGGFGFYRKTSGEITVSFLPEYLMVYVNHQAMLHSITSVETIEELQALVAQEVRIQAHDEPIAHPDDGPQGSRLSPEFGFVRRALRDGSFARRVLGAYEQTCCACGTQLGLVEAAHIIPVASKQNFMTSNGLAFCRNHHHAYDSALIAVFPDYSIRISHSRFQQLKSEGLEGGTELVLDSLFQSIRLPNRALVHPGATYLEESITLRSFRI